ncbi:hypothetical protein [Francisella philomiragia]|uniref:Uncharacterized protein n=1 Tax=Francisella philomiragia TaxID=28110 RepID=A0A0B6D4M0_9GAMM|nr:hypothetical protein [Francisella philomiragia]AJI52608.1 hypothetical protein LA55_278 [Francisella philomiragia]
MSNHLTVNSQRSDTINNNAEVINIDKQYNISDLPKEIVELIELEKLTLKEDLDYPTFKALCQYSYLKVKEYNYNKKELANNDFKFKEIKFHNGEITIGLDKFIISWSFLPYLKYTSNISTPCVISGKIQSIYKCNDGHILKKQFDEKSNHSFKNLYIKLRNIEAISGKIVHCYGVAGKVDDETLVFYPYNSYVVTEPCNNNSKPDLKITDLNIDNQLDIFLDRNIPIALTQEQEDKKKTPLKPFDHLKAFWKSLF